VFYLILPNYNKLLNLEDFKHIHYNINVKRNQRNQIASAVPLRKCYRYQEQLSSKCCYQQLEDATVDPINADEKSSSYSYSTSQIKFYNYEEFQCD